MNGSSRLSLISFPSHVCTYRATLLQEILGNAGKLSCRCGIYYIPGFLAYIDIEDQWSLTDVEIEEDKEELERNELIVKI